ncbi:hypothetical protein L1987_05013 [Smallanthus sonchifolius]|uniref:Uncharacterized protein n=1 Tax=Smallanthus sonchifolius TaxID=185202 RepID=A0ACB9JU59_9ASTR|nr:hypothetical protein L1987_05013 [Smallanthus sonchifolius]
MANDGGVQQPQKNATRGGVEGLWRAVDDLTAKFDRTFTTIKVDDFTAKFDRTLTTIEEPPTTIACGSPAYGCGSSEDEEDKLDYRRNDGRRNNHYDG